MAADRMIRCDIWWWWLQFMLIITWEVTWDIFINHTWYSTWSCCSYCSWYSLLLHVPVLHSVPSSNAMCCGSAGQERLMNSSFKCRSTFPAVALTTVRWICRPVILTTWDIHRVKRCASVSFNGFVKQPKSVGFIGFWIFWGLLWGFFWTSPARCCQLIIEWKNFKEQRCNYSALNAAYWSKF